MRANHLRLVRAGLPGPAGMPSNGPSEVTWPSVIADFGDRLWSWLRAALVESIVLCAFAHDSYHPDLLDYVADRRAPTLGDARP